MALCRVYPLRTFSAGKLILELYDPICDCKFPVTRKFVGGKMVWVGDHPTHGCAVSCYRTFSGGKMIWECEIPDWCDLGDDCEYCSGNTPLYVQVMFADIVACAGFVCDMNVWNTTHILTQSTACVWAKTLSDPCGDGKTGTVCFVLANNLITICAGIDNSPVCCPYYQVFYGTESVTTPINCMTQSGTINNVTICGVYGNADHVGRYGTAEYEMGV